MKDTEKRLYRQIIDRYARKHPGEWMAFNQYLEKSRSELVDKQFGQLDQGAMRFAGTMPSALYNQIRMAAIKFFQIDMDHKYFDNEFLKEFPHFKVAQKL